MEPPRRDADAPNAKLVSVAGRAPLGMMNAEPSGSMRPWVAFGLAHGIVGGLLGALAVVGVALAVALNQQQIIRYTAQYSAYQDCLRENPTSALCQMPTTGVLTVSAIWLLFLGASLLAFALAQVTYTKAARAVALRTGSSSAGVCAAMLAACVGWVLYLVASVGAVFLQASPLTMTAPPPGVDTAMLHLGTAIGNALFDALTLLPAVLVAMVAGWLAASRALKSRVRALASLPPARLAARSTSAAPSPILPPVTRQDSIRITPPPATTDAYPDANRQVRLIEPVASGREVGV